VSGNACRLSSPSFPLVRSDCLVVTHTGCNHEPTIKIATYTTMFTNALCRKYILLITLP
jgi:hypothetical protein